MRHIIRKQILEVHFPASDDSHAFQHQLSIIYKEQLLPIIEKILDEIGQPDQLDRINLVEIDLGNIPMGSLESKHMEEFEQLFRAEIQRQIATHRSQQALPAHA